MYSEGECFRNCNGEECMWYDCEDMCCLDCPDKDSCMCVCSDVANFEECTHFP